MSDQEKFLAMAAVYAMSAVIAAVYLWLIFGGLVKQVLRRRKLLQYFAAWKRLPPGEERPAAELAKAGKLFGEYRRFGRPYRPEEHRNVLEFAQRAGFSIHVDFVSIYREGAPGRPRRLNVRVDFAPYFVRLVRYVNGDDPNAPGKTRLERIDIHLNNNSRTLVTSLGDIEIIKEKCEMSRGLLRRAVRGVVLAGKAKGQRQEWHLDYYP